MLITLTSKLAFNDLGTLRSQTTSGLDVAVYPLFGLWILMVGADQLIADGGETSFSLTDHDQVVKWASRHGVQIILAGE